MLPDESTVGDGVINLSVSGPAVTGLLCAHVGLLLAAPRTSHYYKLKKLALVAGALAVPFLLWGNGWPTITVRLVAISCVVAYGALLCALCLANFSVSLGLRNFRKALSLGVLVETPAAATMILCGVVFEEVIWRAGVQVRLGNNFMAVVAGAVLFHLCHVVKSKKVRIPKMLDIWFFSAVVGVAFLLTHSLFMVIVIHAMRNLHLFHLRYRHEKKYQDMIDTSQTAFRSAVRRKLALLSKPFAGVTRFVEDQTK